ncbi:MAG TPA: hypothetical protein VMW72_01165, partial [Sedimentisphaerales bacterium]|nr:hypothetical protein [Sedimentisphaerales bacterium]
WSHFSFFDSPNVSLDIEGNPNSFSWCNPEKLSLNVKWVQWTQVNVIDPKLTHSAQKRAFPGRKTFQYDR